MTFNQKFHSIIAETGSMVCVGLDPDAGKMPALYSASGSRNTADFLKVIIEAVAPYCSAYKLNLAFFEIMGADGWKILKEIADFIPPNRLKIADGKRGDIGNTAKFYAKSLLEELDFDAATVNPYMGKDSVSPFIENPAKGAFVLALTSNPGADDFQFHYPEKPLFLAVAEKAVQWNEHKNIGLVAGATRPEYFAALRKIAPDLPFLIPGVGAQGGDLQQVVLKAVKGFPGKALINSSRGILYASRNADFDDKAVLAAKNLRDSINELLVN